MGEKARDGLRIGEILIRSRRLTWEQLDKALEVQRISRMALGKILVEEEIVLNKDIFRAIAYQYDMMFWDFDETPEPKDCLDQISKALAYELSVVPVAKKGQILVVAYSHPENTEIKKKIVANLKDEAMGIRMVVSSPDQIEAALEKYYGPKDS